MPCRPLVNSIGNHVAIANRQFAQMAALLRDNQGGKFWAELATGRLKCTLERPSTAPPRD